MSEREELDELRRLDELEAKAASAAPQGRFAQEKSYTMNKIQNGQIPSVFDAIGSLGNIVGGTVNDAVGSVIRGAESLVPNSVENTFARTPQGMMVKAGNYALGKVTDAVGSQFNKLEQSNPDTAHLLGGLGNFALSTPVVEGAATALKGTPQLIAGGKAKFEARRAAEAPQYDPVAGMKKMAEQYAANKEVSGSLYKVRDQIARGKPIDAAGLAEGVDGLIADIKTDPFHEARGIAPRLEELRAKLAPQQGDGVYFPKNQSKFDLADAAELKTILNESFNPARFNQNAKGTVYGKLGGQVDAVLKAGAKQYPEFGAAQELSNKFWLNNVQNAFQDNAVLSKYFKPDDLREFQSLADGRTVSLHPETVKRANATIKNIKSAEDLDAIRLILSPEMAEQLSADVVKRMGPSGRLEALGKAAMGAADLRPHGIARTVGHIADVVGGVKRTPEQQALMNAAKGPKPRMLSPKELAKLKKANQ